MAEKVKACIRASKLLDDSSRFQIFDVLGHLEGELQAKDVIIAALKVIFNRLIYCHPSPSIRLHRSVSDLVRICLSSRNA